MLRNTCIGKTGSCITVQYRPLDTAVDLECNHLACYVAPTFGDIEDCSTKFPSVTIYLLFRAEIAGSITFAFFSY